MNAKALALGVAGAAALVSARAEAAPCQGRPTDPAGFQGYSYAAAPVRSHATARFRVHYAASGTHAPDPATTRGDGVPDSVALVAGIAETSLAKYVEMGFKQPPSDVTCTSNGGDDKLDVYLVAFAGADGTTVPEACEGRVCSSFVLVDSTFAARGYPSTAEGFQTVVSHELFHAVQNAYDSEIDRFWAEGTAQWAMKSVYPELVDFERQLPAFFKDNTRSLDTQPSGVTAGFLYGSAVWPLFLTLRHGGPTVREIMEREGDGTKAIAATEAALASKGSSVAEALPMFGAWNAATGPLAGKSGYPDATRYPGVKSATLDDGAGATTSGLGYYVYRGTLEAASKVSLDTDPTRNAGVLIPIEGGAANLERAARLPANAEGEVLVVVAGITTKKTDAPFTVRIGAPDPGAASPPRPSGDAGSGEGEGDTGGCTAAPLAGLPGGGARSLAALATLVAVAACVRRRRARS